MTVEIEKEMRHLLEPLFNGWNETLILSCLQGHMGEAWVDDANHPASAFVLAADFCFFAGHPCRELLTAAPILASGFLLLIPKNEKWSVLIEEVWGTAAKRFTRYATKKEPDAFDRQALQKNAAALPEGYEIREIDEPIYHRLLAEAWSHDLCSQFSTWEEFREKGLGLVVMAKASDGSFVPVSGTSTYGVYDGGVEIEIDTKESCRGRGLAAACASAFILLCLDRGLYPSWDAHDKRSLALAEKLGYQLDFEYTAYELRPSLAGRSIGAPDSMPPTKPKRQT